MTRTATALSAGDPASRQRSQPLCPHWCSTATPPWCGNPSGASYFTLLLRRLRPVPWAASQGRLGSGEQLAWSRLVVPPAGSQGAQPAGG